MLADEAERHRDLAAAAAYLECALCPPYAAVLLPFTEACAWLHLAVLLHVPRGEREAADEQRLRRWRRTPAHAWAPARGGRGRAVAPAVVEEEPPGDLRRRRGGSEGREEREGAKG